MNFKCEVRNRIIYIVQKMMKKDEAVNKNSEVASICSELNLNTDKLNIEQLMNNATYRRLYNIVINDMSRSELSFRKNLIKELYFLLQIAPIIKAELKQHFLSEVEKWYNLNDHKKIDLASNKLNRLLHIVHHSKKQSTHEPPLERPKTGVTWNQNVSPFLRPYTAKRSDSNLKGGKKMRPQSSKFGAQSTKVDTNDDYFIREFTTNIQEELQISQDFLQKHRTNHPEYEPTYEQLYKILKKIETNSNIDKEEILQIPITKCTRYSKSAIPRKKQTVVEQMQSNKQITDQSQEAIGLQDRAKDSDQSSDQEEEILYVSQSKKEQIKKCAKPQIKTEEAVVEQQFDNLFKYTNQIENKLVQALREDRQMARKYVDFARTKTSMKKQLNRKNQSKRLLSAKLSTARSYKITRNKDNKENNTQATCAVYDLTLDPLNVVPDPINAYPTYNRREFLKKRYEEPVRAFKKLNNVEEVSEKIKPNVKRPMTAFVRFHSPIRFDPMSDDNVKKYNEEVLQQIQKIKIKMGNKCSASTDSLMKALYIDSASNDDQFKWQDQNPCYGMISKGKQKKLKKKGRRLKSKPKLQVNK